MLGPVIDVGALVSMFAGTLACLTAAARVLLLMAHDGLAHGSLRRTHARNGTPGGAILATGLGAFLPVAVLAAWHSSGLDVYGWLGTLATYGFVVSYGLVCFALPRDFAQSPWLRQLGDADDPVDRVCGHGICAGRQSLSGARGRVRQAALHLSRLFGGDDRGFRDRRQKQERCPGESVAFAFSFSGCFDSQTQTPKHSTHARHWESPRRHHEALHYATETPVTNEVLNLIAHLPTKSLAGIVEDGFFRS